MNARKIPVVKVGRAGVTGTPEDFENHFDRKRKTVKRAIPEHQSKLKPVDNRSMDELLAEHNLGER